MSFGNPQGIIESGFVDFSGETEKTVTLALASKPGEINIMVNETQSTSASANTETDIPARNLGNIQISAMWVPSETKQFTITTSAEFYGRVIWSIITK